MNRQTRLEVKCLDWVLWVLVVVLLLLFLSGKFG